MKMKKIYLLLIIITIMLFLFNFNYTGGNNRRRKRRFKTLLKSVNKKSNIPYNLIQNIRKKIYSYINNADENYIRLNLLTIDYNFKNKKIPLEEIYVHENDTPEIMLNIINRKYINARFLIHNGRNITCELNKNMKIKDLNIKNDDDIIVIALNETLNKINSTIELKTFGL